MTSQPSFMCPRCAMESFNPHDIEHGYCGACHWWTGDPVLGSKEVIAAAEREGAIDPAPNYDDVTDRMFESAVRALRTLSKINDPRERRRGLIKLLHLHDPDPDDQ